ARTYDEFPSVPRPWLLALGGAESPEQFNAWWWRVPVDVILRLFFCSMGMLVTLLLRPKDRWASLAAGLATGLFAGLVTYTLVLGPVVTSRRVLRSQELDLQLLSYGCFDSKLGLHLGQEPDVVRAEGKGGPTC